VHDPTTARRILATLGAEPGAHLERIGDGFASEAWRSVLPSLGPVVLRVANERGLVEVSYPMEHALLDRLGAAGAPVPRPVAGSWQTAGWAGPAWSLTTWAAGRPLQPRDHARAVPGLVAIVRALRVVAVAGGHGPLVVDGAGVLRGAAPEPAEGLVTWAARPLWPLDGSRLADHPAIGEDPSLVEAMDAHAVDVRDALLSGPRSVLHSDLHGENVLDDEGRLTILDVGEALVGPVDWDIAAIAFFLDWPTADAVALALGDDRIDA
jgi:Ser/Thr protein kinase RdoA (MazF antagonist)